MYNSPAYQTLTLTIFVNKILKKEEKSNKKGHRHEIVKSINEKNFSLNALTVMP